MGQWQAFVAEGSFPAGWTRTGEVNRNRAQWPRQERWELRRGGEGLGRQVDELSGSADWHGELVGGSRKT